jgi:hypothetical protein
MVGGYLAAAWGERLVAANGGRRREAAAAGGGMQRGRRVAGSLHLRI